MIGPSDPAGTTPEGLLISAGTGETMAAAFGLGIGLGDAVVSLGASGSVMAVHPEALFDSSGMITSLADATGMHLPVVTTLNAVRALRGTAELLGLPDLESLSDLALKSTPGSHGLVLLPYLEGERTPNLPHTAGTREYLTCERGQIELAAGGATFALEPGDVVVFRGDQKHGYRNPGISTTIAYSVVAFAPVGP